MVTDHVTYMTASDRDYEPPTLVEYGELETVTEGRGGSLADGKSETPGRSRGRGSGNGNPGSGRGQGP